MEYQKIIDLSGNIWNQLSKFSTKNWVETNGDSRETDNTNCQTKVKTTMLNSDSCNYSDAYIHLKGKKITGAGADATARQADEINKGVIFKNCAPFT